MKFHKIKKDEYRISDWSGGSTTELMIYPEDADYAKREFLWRISSAVVELEKSDFTPLPGVERIIMPLDSELKLNHIGHRKVNLKPFEQDSFPGDWQTESRGKLRDFNVMCKDGAEASLEYFQVSEDENLELNLDGSAVNSILLFCYRGEIKVLSSKCFSIIEEESLFLQLEQNEHGYLKIQAKQKSDLLVVRVRHTTS